MAFFGALSIAPTISLSATPPLADVLLQDIRANHSTSFQNLLTRWEVKYGSSAFSALARIAKDSSHEDTERYIAVMGMAKLGGFNSAPLLTPYLKDSSWMVRTASLRALTALDNPKTSQAILPLLRDRALVVRIEAINSIEKLKPVGFENAWVATLTDPTNYHHGKAQWVPQKALEFLARTRIEDPAAKKKILSELHTISIHPMDKELKPTLLLTIRRIQNST